MKSSQWMLATALFCGANGAALSVPLSQFGSPQMISESAQKELLAGNYTCGAAASACPKCVPAGGGCGTCFSPPLVTLYVCVLYFPPYGHAGCATSASIRHCSFSCTGSCATKAGGANCGDFFTLDGILGCGCAAGVPCAATKCTDSLGTGSVCFECT
jgi:hypothetical protein